MPNESASELSGEFWVWRKDHLVRASRMEVDSLLGSRSAVTWVTEHRPPAPEEGRIRVSLREAESVRS